MLHLSGSLGHINLPRNGCSFHFSSIVSCSKGILSNWRRSLLLIFFSEFLLCSNFLYIGATLSKYFVLRVWGNKEGEEDSEK